jgi:hypothetical protein
MDELKALFKVCAHIKSDGIRCGSPAMSGMNFCFQHIGGRPMAFVRAKATTTFTTNLPLAYPGTREAIQHNLALVAQALNEGNIDPSTANAYTRLYRITEQNLTRWEKASHANQSNQTNPGHATPAPQMLPVWNDNATDSDSNEAERDNEVAQPDTANAANGTHSQEDREARENGPEEATHEDAMCEEATHEGAMREQAACKDTMPEGTTCGESTGQGALLEKAASKEDMCEEATHEGTACEESTCEEEMRASALSENEILAAPCKRPMTEAEKFDDARQRLEDIYFGRIPA